MAGPIAKKHPTVVTQGGLHSDCFDFKTFGYCLILPDTARVGVEEKIQSSWKKVLFVAKIG